MLSPVDFETRKQKLIKAGVKETMGLNAIEAVETIRL